MQKQDQDHEAQNEFLQEENNQNPSSNVLDPQTLENLAAFLSREPDEQTSEEAKDQSKRTTDTTTRQSRIEHSKENSSKSDSRSESSSPSRSRSREKSQPRWIYCCSKCKKSKGRDKSCLCIVPASQRRIPLHKEGCSTCRCQGCSKEDVQLDYERKKAEEAESKSHFELMRNGCCKECMKAFSGSGKACICQVPASVRRRKLPDSGCIYCGCFGCNPEDTQKTTNTRERSLTPEKLKHGHRKTAPKIKTKRSEDSLSRSRSRSDSYESSLPSTREQEEQLNNLDNSYIGNFLRKTFNIYPPLMGFGIPQRTYTYIYGKPQPR